LFPIEIPPVVQERVAQKLGEKRLFIHISPFATLDEKELSLESLADFINAAQLARPDLALVISTAPNAREKNKLAALLSCLRSKPWRVFPGDLDLVELAGVISRATMHWGGDSGALHVALMAGTPTLSWWRDYPGRVEWQPQGPQHTAVVAAQDSAGYLAANPAELLRLFVAAIGPTPARKR
jgi:ADP-heptose:LPS heptosyltransferase